MSKGRFCKKPKFGYYCTWAEGHLDDYCNDYPEWWMEMWLALTGGVKKLFRR